MLTPHFGAESSPGLSVFQGNRKLWSESRFQLANCTSESSSFFNSAAKYLYYARVNYLQVLRLPPCNRRGCLALLSKGPRSAQTKGTIGGSTVVLKND